MSKSKAPVAPAFTLSGAYPERYRELFEGVAGFIAETLGRKVEGNPFAPVPADPDFAETAYSTLKEHGVVCHWALDGMGTRWVVGKPETCHLCEETAGNVLVAGSSMYGMAFSPITYLCTQHARTVVLSVAAKMTISFTNGLNERLAILRQYRTGESQNVTGLALPLKTFLRYAPLRYLTDGERDASAINFAPPSLHVD